MTLTDTMIRQWAGIVLPEYQTATLKTPGPDNTRSDAEIIARAIIAEENNADAMVAVAQEMLNRLRYRRVLNGKGMSFDRTVGGYSLPWGSWREVLYMENAYTGLTHIHTNDIASNPMGVDLEAGESVLTKPIPATWRLACELAYELTNIDPLYISRLDRNTLLNDQLFHRGVKSLNASTQAELCNLFGIASISEWTTVHGQFIKRGTFSKLRHSILALGDSVFFNENDATNGNNICSIMIPPTGTEDPNNTGIAPQDASDFIDFLKSRVGCGYVLGTYGQICTQQLLENRASADPENGSSYYLGDCSRWMGKLVTDCSGLIEWFLLKRGVSNCDSYSGGMYRNWCSDKSTNMSLMPHTPGVALFKKNDKGIYHVGIYVGKDRVIEAKGAAYGVVVTQFSADPAWNAWGKFDWLDYNITEADVIQLPVVTDALTYGPLPGYPDIRTSADEVVQHSGSYSSPVYRKGDSGDKIEMIRRRFWAEDSSFIVNNFFDDVLEAKVQVFQTANSLTADGLVGSGTWKRLFPVLKKRTGSQAGAPAMQALLNYQNYPVGTPDGLFGTGTETILKAYQAARQLDADGVCGEKTWQSLTLDEPFENEVLIDQNGDSTTLCEMGDSNTTVKQLQKRLSLNYHLAVSGTYDSATDACVRAYQQANGITANGNVGPITWKKLFPILKMGRGTKDEVRALQMLLCYQKHSVLIDGIFGSGTMAAVKAYQTLRNITSDGIVGENTWASLCIATSPDGAGQYFGTGGGSTGGNSNTIYRQGDTGAAVHQIKRRMAVENLFSGTVDSTFDVQLTYDVKRYQAAEGTRIDGLVGPATWSLLFPIVKKQVGQQSGAKAVQALLNLNGYNVGTPDGLFGTGSENKLKQFQTANGLTSDGVCGANTWAKLCEV